MDDYTEQMELLSEKIRRGEPVGFLEAIAAINYQEQQKAIREAEEKATLLGRIKSLFRKCLPGR